MKLPIVRSTLALTLAGLGILLFTGCADDEVYNGRVVHHRVVAYDGGGPDYGPGPGYADYGPDYGPADYGVDDDDFYYVGGQPYSRSYGVLVLRDGGYYYRHGGGYVVYNRARGHYGRGGAVRGRYDGGGHNRTVADDRGRVRGGFGQSAQQNNYRQRSYQGQGDLRGADIQRRQQQTYGNANVYQRRSNPQGAYQQRAPQGGFRPQVQAQQRSQPQQQVQRKKHSDQ